MTTYIIIGLLWALFCVAIGLYISAYKIKAKTHYMAGFITIGVTFLIGLGMLIGAIAISIQ
ncbi:MAG: hypothetical protein JSU07_12715 [Bacteroidetes bacterium]|nr:hypothetical protein [Bacteroidota bacterium]